MLESSHIAFAIQSGIVLWEEPEPKPDWRWKTVTICSGELGAVTSLVRQLVSSRPLSLPFGYRLHLSPIPAGTGAARRRKLVQALRRDAPGFVGTHIAQADGGFCVAASLSDIDAMDLNYFTSCRDTVLIEAGASIRSPEALCELLCSAATELGAAEIVRMLEARPPAAILRVIERDSYAAVQLIGTQEASLKAAEVLAACGARRIRDITSFPAEIARLRR